MRIALFMLGRLRLRSRPCLLVRGLLGLLRGGAGLFALPLLVLRALQLFALELFALPLLVLRALYLFTLELLALHLFALALLALALFALRP